MRSSSISLFLTVAATWLGACSPALEAALLTPASVNLNCKLASEQAAPAAATAMTPHSGGGSVNEAIDAT